MTVACPTSTPATSVMALSDPGVPSNGIPRSRARGFWADAGEATATRTATDTADNSRMGDQFAPVWSGGRWGLDMMDPPGDSGTPRTSLRNERPDSPPARRAPNMLIHLPSISTRCIRSTPQTAVSSRKPSCPYPNRSRRRSAGPTRHGRSRSLHKLDREPIEVCDHQRPCISKWMRPSRIVTPSRRSRSNHSSRSPTVNATWSYTCPRDGTSG